MHVKKNINVIASIFFLNAYVRMFKHEENVQYEKPTDNVYACVHIQEYENEHCIHIANLLKQIHT